MQWFSYLRIILLLSQNRPSICKYRSLAEKLKDKPLSEETLREVTALKDANTKRAAELRQMYIREE